MAIMGRLRRNALALSLGFYCIVCFFALRLYLSRGHSHILEDSIAITGRKPTIAGSQNAYCVFLAEPNEMLKKGDDPYYEGVRMLIYQLLHDPSTRTTAGIPFVVVVSENVPQWKRDQLEYEGARVVAVPHIDVPWIKPGRPRWKYVMDKLHIFELVEYEKILLLDTDIVVARPLDGIFDDPAAKLLDNKNNSEQIQADEGTQPARYLMAGNGVNSINHTYPTARSARLNAGFVLLKPSIEMYNHHLQVAMIEGRFRGSSPEQDLWNYIHRPDGNMPWQQLDPDWTINNPNINDYNNNIVTFHEKYWHCRDAQIRDILLRSRYRMEGFFQSYIKNDLKS